MYLVLSIFILVTLKLIITLIVTIRADVQLLTRVSDQTNVQLDALLRSRVKFASAGVKLNSIVGLWIGITYTRHHNITSYESKPTMVHKRVCFLPGINVLL